MFSNLPTSVRILGFLFHFLVTVLCVILGSLNFMLRKKRLITLIEIISIGSGALATIIVLTPLVSFVRYPVVLIVLSMTYAAVAMTMFSVAVVNENPLPIIDGVISLLLSPIVMIPSSVVEWVSFLSAFYYFARCMRFFYKTLRYVREDEGRFMVKAAMDFCADGIIFVDRLDRFSYVNPAMERILTRLGLPGNASATELIARLKLLAVRTLGKDAIVVKVGLRYFQINWISRGNSIQEISSMDITEEELASASLEESTLEAEKAVSELREALLSLNTEIRKEELARIKGSVHDSFAQELSILYRYLDNPSITSYSSIKKMLEESRLTLSRSTRQEEPITLESVKEMFDLIGLTIQIEGDLPEDSLRQQVFLQSLKEACTNAVKHGDATTMFVSCVEKEGKYIMKISNNGTSPDEIVEGNGIKAIRFRLELIKGEVRIENSPTYTLVVSA